MQTKAYDVIVCGGGPAGIAAAVAAARNGAKTLLIEKNAFVGGCAASGLPFLNFFNRNRVQVIRGVGEELVQRMQAELETKEYTAQAGVNGQKALLRHWRHETAQALEQLNAQHCRYWRDWSQSLQ